MTTDYVRGSTSTTAARRAVLDAGPIALAVVPFGLAIGAAGATADLSLATTLFGAIVLLAGASQLVTIDAVADGGTLGGLIVVVLLMNARFTVYSAGLSGWFRSRATWRRVLLAVPVIDQTFVLCQQAFADIDDEADRERYYLVAVGALATTFVASQAIGHRVGANVPDSLGLHLATPLVFAGMLSTAVRERADLVAAAISTSVLLAVTTIAAAVALPLAMIGGIMAGRRVVRAKAHES